MLQLAGALILIPTLLVMPWLIGSKPDWARWGISLPLIVSALLTCLGVIFSKGAGRISSLIICLLLTLAFAGFQLIPGAQPPYEKIDHAVLSDLVSPPATEVASLVDMKSGPLSASPPRTFSNLALYGGAAAVFIVASLLSSHPLFVRALLFSLTINGLTLSILGMYQKLRWENVIYGFYVNEFGGLPFASFVNRNNASSYLLVCFAAGLGMLIGMRQKREPQGYHWKEEKEQDTAIILALSLGMIAAGIVASLSRSGIISLVSGLLVTIPFLLRSKRASIATSLAVVLWFGVIVWFGWSAESIARFFQIDSDVMKIGRIQHWQHTAAAIYDWGFWGSGLGTYADVNRPYQTSTLWYVNADNQYVEWMLELGLLGMIPVGVFLLGLGWHTKRLLTRFSMTGNGLRYGTLLLFLLASQMIHACFDFGITIPATLFTFAALCGVATSKSIEYAQVKMVGDRVVTPRQQPTSMSTKVVQMGLALVAILMIAAASLQYYLDYRAEEIARSTRSLTKSVPTRENLDRLDDTKQSIEKFQSELPTHPRVLESEASLGEYEFRHQIYQYLQPDAEEIEPREWELTTLNQLVLSSLGTESLTVQLRRLVNQTELKQTLEDVEQKLRQTLQHRPLRGDLWQKLAVVHWLMMEADSRIMTESGEAALLRPFDPETQMIYAMLLAESEDPERSLAIFRRITTLPEPDWQRLWGSGRRYFDVEVLAEKVIPANAKARLDLIDEIRNVSEREEFADWVVVHTEDSSDAFDNYLLGRAWQMKGNPEKAALYYGRAVQERSLESAWKLTFAQTLFTLERYQEAKRQLEQANRLDPTNKSISQLHKKVLSKL